MEVKEGLAPEEFLQPGTFLPGLSGCMSDFKKFPEELLLLARIMEHTVGN